MPVFAFDIETIPDVELGRRVHGLDGLSDKEVGYVMQAKRREATGSEFLSYEQQRVVAISVALRAGDSFKVWSLGDAQSSEAEIIGRFFDGIDKYTPDLISWNGGGFDLPVLHYRAMRHGIQAPRYWEAGNEDQAFRFNNYLNRYHTRHLDLMDVLSSYQSRARVSLQAAAMLLGLPGKLGMSGDKVWDAYLAGDIEIIRNYCETDVLNTFLIYLRFELMRGMLNRDEYHAECERVRSALRAQPKPHLDEFLAAWTEQQI
ncbi:MAG TPA: 3'-5' exonuclease [Povalibacter sp.]|jgi:predicted PolB exonuclease-like 3'-5' exonuclease|nr:3'-5' exonuclease [Povalibacter sp.]